MRQHHLILINFILLLLILGCAQAPEDRKIIQTDNAPQAIGPYSQAVQSGNMLFLAGQIALEPGSGVMVAGGIVEQTKQAIENAKAVLTAAGFSLKDVVQVQIYLKDLNEYVVMNKVYAEYFNELKPARAVVEVNRIPKDALIEIMMTAMKQK
jgi:2-iminobutanoate/2-iminopropanoate deaminase